MSKPKLTPHQREVHDRLSALSRNGERWVHVRTIGSRGALARLVAKGYAEVKVEHGSRGGSHEHYRVRSNDTSEPYVRYGKRDGKAHYVTGPAHPGGPSLCGLGADDMEDGLYVAYVCERCYERSSANDSDSWAELAD